MERWRRRLTVTADTQQAPDEAHEPDQAQASVQDEGAAAVEYQYLPESERREAGTALQGHSSPPHRPLASYLFQGHRLPVPSLPRCDYSCRHRLALCMTIKEIFKTQVEAVPLCRRHPSAGAGHGGAGARGGRQGRSRSRSRRG